MNQDDGAWNIECKTCGLIPSAHNRDAIPATVGEHWIIYHGPAAAIEGRDWISYPAIDRCDVCSVPVEWPAWEHATPEPLGEAFEDLDGRWILCDACHSFFVRRLRSAWVRHWITVSLTQIRLGQVPNIDVEETLTEMRVMIAAHISTLFEKLDAGRRVTSRLRPRQDCLSGGARRVPAPSPRTARSSTSTSSTTARSPSVKTTRMSLATPTSTTGRCRSCLSSSSSSVCRRTD